MFSKLPLALLAALPLVPVWAAPTCSLRSPNAADAASNQSPISSPGSPSSPSSSGSGSSGSSNSTGAVSGDVVAMTWYAGWHGTDLPPQNVAWSKYSYVTYSFAVTQSDGTVSLQASDAQLLPQFVQNAHENGVKAMLTVGGWTGSAYFSTAVGSEANRTAFVQQVLDLVTQYSLDGLDFDWEYPGKAGAPCNIINEADDSANYLSFLQALRAAAPQNLTISAAVGVTPFAANGAPMSDVSQFASVLDWIEIMNYDVWGMWSTSGVGPNSPLNDTCMPQQLGSAVSAVAAWTKAGFPADQLVLGVASYGHSFQVTTANALTPTGTLASYPPFSTYQPQGDSWDVLSAASPTCCGCTINVSAPEVYDGIYDFWGLVQDGYLTANGSVAAGIDYRYDECSQTPYVYNPSKQEMVSFDNAQSFAAKGAYIKQANLRGFAMWEAAGDSNNILLDAISQAISIQQ